MRSDVMKQGAQRAPQRSLLKAVGLTDAQISKPLIGIVNSVISLYYYFGILKPVYFGEPGTEDSPLPVPWRFRAGLLVCLAVIMVLGLCPELTHMTMEAGAAVLAQPGTP